MSVSTECLEKRYAGTIGALRGLAAAISLYFITLSICSGLIGGAKLLEEVSTSIPPARAVT